MPPITRERHRMISPDGVKANMICASCEYIRHPHERLCMKQNIAVAGDGYCSEYKMAKFFEERGYKPIN